MMKYKVAAYLRLSKEEFSNEKESNSIINQKLIVDNYLKEHNEYKLVDYYIDDDILVLILIDQNFKECWKILNMII